MKRFWQTWLAVVAVATMVNTADAQWNQSAEIGSYQSILSRAGYGQSMGGQAVQGSMSHNAGGQVAIPSPPGTPVTYGGGMQGAGCGTPACAGGMNGGVMNGGGMNGGGMNGGGMNGGVIANGGMMNGGMVSGGMNGGMVGSGAATGGDGMIGVPCGTYDGYTGGAYAADYGAPVYSPGQNFNAGMAQRLAARSSNLVVGLFGVVLRRDYEDDRRLGYNAAGTNLFSTDADHGNMSGIGISLANRNANGSGWETLYWGLDEDADISLAGPSYTNLNGFSALDHVPSGATVLDIYNAGDSARLYRSTEINNFEFNMLRNGGQFTTRGGRTGNYELLSGFRLFQFNENLRYASNSSFGAYPTRLEYDSNAENLLTGLQVGGRREVCISNRLRLSQAATLGLFNNRIRTRQRVTDETGYNPVLNAGGSAGRSFDYMDEKNDVAMLGQFDLGLIYQFSQKARARVGYRALGVGGVALAADQIPYDFTDTHTIQRANSNGSLLMHGLFFGTELCF
ncbi:MAG: BBP7 family outer membrane beta-barrel protein [Mariniblastus sp.]